MNYTLSSNHILSVFITENESQMPRVSLKFGKVYNHLTKILADSYDWLRISFSIIEFKFVQILKSYKLFVPHSSYMSIKS